MTLTTQRTESRVSSSHGRAQLTRLDALTVSWESPAQQGDLLESHVSCKQQSPEMNTKDK